MYVRGDQWPLFLYEDSKFDAENPWEGLLRSQLLVLVRRKLLYYTGMRLNTNYHRLTNMYLCLQVQPSKTMQKQQDLATRTYTA